MALSQILPFAARIGYQTLRIFKNIMKALLQIPVFCHFPTKQSLVIQGPVISKKLIYNSPMKDLKLGSSLSSYAIQIIAIILLFLLASCGRKSELQRPADYQRPNFDGYSDEMDYPAKKPIVASPKSR